MARKRDVIAEILEKRKRLGRKTVRAQTAITRGLAILPLINETRRIRVAPSTKREISQHVAVALIGLLEGYLRVVIRDLINSGAPFRDNATKFEGLRIDTAVVLRMQTARVSAGELIAHLLPISSVEDIQRHMGALMDIDFFTELRGQPAGNNKTYATVEPNAWAAIAEVFGDRHVICHEFTPRVRRSRDQLRKQWATVMRFIIVVDNYVERRRGSRAAI
jgi:hypothetical protein